MGGNNGCFLRSLPSEMFGCTQKTDSFFGNGYFLFKLRYITEKVCLEFRSRYKECIRMLNGLEKTLKRKFQSYGMIHFEVTPVPRSKPEDLNETLLVEYFRRVRDIGYDDKPKWLRLLIDNQILSEELGAVNCTLAGLILFGKKDRVKKLIPRTDNCKP